LLFICLIGMYSLASHGSSCCSALIEWFAGIDNLTYGRKRRNSVGIPLALDLWQKTSKFCWDSTCFDIIEIFRWTFFTIDWTLRISSKSEISSSIMLCSSCSFKACSV
jgi:hypothetical protein